MPTNCRPLAPCAACVRTKWGISSRHGPHQVAQKFTTTTLPRHCASGCSRPARSGRTRPRSAADERRRIRDASTAAYPAPTPVTAAIAPPMMRVRRRMVRLVEKTLRSWLDEVAGPRPGRRDGDANLLRIGRIADACVGAALRLGVERQHLARCRCVLQRDAQIDDTAVGVDVAEE